MSEIKDAKLIFNQAWKNIEDHYGRENIRLPREFIFLMGAPGYIENYGYSDIECINNFV